MPRTTYNLRPRLAAAILSGVELIDGRELEFNRTSMVYWCRVAGIEKVEAELYRVTAAAMAWAINYRDHEAAIATASERVEMRRARWREQNAAYRNQNRERHLARRRAAYALKSDHYRAYNRDWCAANPGRLCAIRAEAKIRAYNRRCLAHDNESTVAAELRAHRRAWYAANAERIRPIRNECARQYRIKQKQLCGAAAGDTYAQ